MKKKEISDRAAATNVAMTPATKAHIQVIGESLQRGTKPMSRSEVIRRMAESFYQTIMRRRQAGSKSEPSPPPQE